MRVPIWVAVLWGPLHLCIGVVLYRLGRSTGEGRRRQQKKWFEDARREGWTVERPGLGDVVVYADYFRREGDLIVFRDDATEETNALGCIVSAFDVAEVRCVHSPGASVHGTDTEVAE